MTDFEIKTELVQAKLLQMGGLVEIAIRDSVRSLVERDCELAAVVMSQDQIIDQMEIEINRDATGLLTSIRADEQGLNAILAHIEISGNLERIADYAKNLAKRLTVLVQLPPISGASGSIKRMAREVELMLRDVLDAYVQNNTELASNVRARDHDVDQMYNALFREFLTFMMEDPRSITACMHLHFIAKNIERMGDHVTAIAEQIILLNTGYIPTDARPKIDYLYGVSQ